MSGNNSTVAEHLTTDPKIKGSTLVVTWHQEKMIDIFIVLANDSSSVVEHLTIEPKIKGSNPVAAWHQEKM